MVIGKLSGESQVHLVTPLLQTLWIVYLLSHTIASVLNWF
jgi:hypothetical protein